MSRAFGLAAVAAAAALSGRAAPGAIARRRRA
jgi:hypothetical protein